MLIRTMTRSAAETRALGALLSKDLGAGDLVVLRGDLGAGKSEMSRGILRGKGVSGPIPSPTFTLLNLYEAGGETLCHYDWYRVGDPGEIWEAGFHEMLPGDTLAMVEWPERAEEALPDCRLEVCLEYGPGEDERVITLRPMGGFHPLDTLMKDLEQFGGSVE